MEAPLRLVPFWFIVIAVLWTGFFVLEGFDFGVGMLHGVVGKDEAGRRAAMNTIGPLWDGNEGWLIVAGGALFAAVPGPGPGAPAGPRSTRSGRCGMATRCG